MLRRLIPSLLALALLSCSDSTSPADILHGTWDLETVNGQPVPYILEQNAGLKLELTGETVTLLPAGRQTMVTYFRLTESGIVSTEAITAPGSYTRSGRTLTLSFDSDTDTYTATLDGDLMTIDDMGLRFVYRYR
jgi:hypothetical protein